MFTPVYTIYPDLGTKSETTEVPPDDKGQIKDTPEDIVQDVMVGNKSVIGRLFNGFGAFDHILEAIFLYLGPYSSNPN